MNQLLHSILKGYSSKEIVQMCKIINKDYNVYDPEEVRWSKLEYVLSRTTREEFEQLRSSYLCSSW